VTVISGSEPLLVDRAVDALLRAAREESDDAEVHELDVSNVRSGELAVLCSPSLFGGAPVVVVRGVERLKADAGDLQDAQEEVLGHLAAPTEDARLVLVHGGGNAGKAVLTAAKKAGATMISVSGPSKPWEVEPHRRDFVRAEFKTAGRTITPDAVNLLVDAVGFDLYELAAACAQLTSDVPDTVGVEAVRTYYAGQAEISWFDVADEAMAGQTAAALAKVRALMDSGTDPVPVVAAVAGQVRRVARVAAAPRSVSKNDLAAALGVRPGSIDKARTQAQGWTPNGLAIAVQAVVAADEAVKGGEVSREYALERMLVQLGRARATRD
jgi:DNA polymerase III subunit delta